MTRSDDQRLSSALLVLRALDALDGDEAAAVDLVLAHQPALRRCYEEYCDLVDDPRSAPPHIAPLRVSPSAGVLARLWHAIDNTATN